MRLAATCQLADERAAANPSDRTAANYSEAMAELFYDALELPEDHPLFERWQEHQWLPLELRESSTD